MASTILANPAETIAFGRAYAAHLKGGEVIGLRGDLGAGKTHFVKGLAAGLGGSADAVTSPTFTLIHEYTDGRIPLFHFDLYRLEGDDELLNLGFDDYVESGGILAIEWAEKFSLWLPRTTRWLRFSHRADGTRQVEEVEE